MRVLAILLMVFLAACASRPGNGYYWVGRPGAALIQALGPPDERIPLAGGGEVLAYEQKEKIELPGYTPLSGSDYQTSGASMPPAREALITCIYEYQVGRDGIISSMRTREGTGCLK